MANRLNADNETDPLAWLVGEVMGDGQLSAADGSPEEALYARLAGIGLLEMYDCHAGRDWYRMSDGAMKAIAARLGTS